MTSNDPIQFPRFSNTVVCARVVSNVLLPQTGSGKTFTMEGPPDNRGVNFRALNRLFELGAQPVFAVPPEGKLICRLVVCLLQRWSARARSRTRSR
jgi:hypothetical protein